MKNLLKLFPGLAIILLLFFSQCFNPPAMIYLDEVTVTDFYNITVKGRIDINRKVSDYGIWIEDVINNETPILISLGVPEESKEFTYSFTVTDFSKYTLKLYFKKNDKIYFSENSETFYAGVISALIKLDDVTVSNNIVRVLGSIDIMANITLSDYGIWVEKNNNFYKKYSLGSTSTDVNIDYSFPLNELGSYNIKLYGVYNNDTFYSRKEMSIKINFITWQKCLGGSGDDKGYSIDQTTDGGFIVAGYTNSNDGDVSGKHGNYDFWVLKLNNIGDIQWQKCLGGNDEDYAESIQQTTDGGYIVAGYTKSNDGDVSNNRGGFDFWIVKLNSNGDIQWQKCIGGTEDDKAHFIQQTTDGGYIVAGETWSNNLDVTGNHGGADFWVVKLNSNGDILWQKCLGGSANEYAYSIQQTTDGGYIVAGYTYSNDGDVSGYHGIGDFWVVKLSSSGDIQWQRCLGTGYTDWASTVQQTTDGGYIVAGWTSAATYGWFDYKIVKLNSNGDIQWSKTLGGYSGDKARAIQQTSDGGYIVIGSSNSNDEYVSNNHGSYDFWVVKLNSSGDIQWQKCLGGMFDDYPISIQQLANDGYIIAGHTSSYDGDVSGNHGDWDFWVVKINSSP